MNVQHSPARLFGLGFVTLCLLVALFFAGKWGVAAVSHGIAMNHFNGWLKSDKKPKQHSWKQVESALVFSVSLDAKNAGYINDLGRFYEYTAALNIESEAQFLEESLSSFRSATLLRPSWAIAWANVALLKHKTEQIDEEFEFAMLRAMILGKALRPVQTMVTEAGVANWLKISVHLRRQVLDFIHHGLNMRYKYEIMGIIKDYKMKPYFCLILPKSDQEMFCKK